VFAGASNMLHAVSNPTGFANMTYDLRTLLEMFCSLHFQTETPKTKSQSK
jgi:hypothetical protein